MKQAVQVTILGQAYTIRSEASPEEVRRVADLVNQQVAEVRESGRTVDTLNLAVLALMNLGGAYMRLQDGRQETTQAMERLRRVLDRLEQVVPEAPTEPRGLFPG